MEKCNDDSQCKGNEICLNGECQEGCTNDYHCKHKFVYINQQKLGTKCYKNKCVPTCELNGQHGIRCRSPQYCHIDHKVCLDKCSSNFDCEDDYKCHNGKCLQPCNESKDPCMASDQYCHK